jgi:hypothetical protein
MDPIDKGYLGNLNLKRKGVAIDWTKAQIKEFLKCAEDPIYFSEKYINIVHVDHGLIPIVLYDYQKEIVRKITDNRRVAVVTSRQAGKTTTAVAVILHYILFNDHKTVALLANKGDSAREILDRIKIAYEALPKWIQQGVIEWNKGSVEFENGCKIIAGATSSSAIRGKSISLLYIDETAFVENWDEFFASVFPTISSGKTTKILLTSTPNGLNHFYKTCEGAKEGTNGYQYVEVPWVDVPGRDEEWKKDTLASMDFDLQKFAQEFECEFLGSSGTLIDGSKLKSLVSRQPIEERNGISMYAEEEKDHIYFCIVDVSRGKGLDYSAFHIIDATTMPYKQVCTFRDNMIVPIEYTEIIHRMCKKYNDAIVLVEVNDIGEQIPALLLYDYEYENILYTESAGRAGKRISGGFGRKGSSIDKGIRTTKQVKSIGCSVLKLLIEQDQLIINDFNTINELSTFSRKGVSYEAESGCHDDLVMGLVLFAWLSDQEFFKGYTDNNTLAALRDRSHEEVMEGLLPFAIIDDGMLDEEDPGSAEDWGGDSDMARGKVTEWGGGSFF